jgi:hypothetical protein
MPVYKPFYTASFQKCVRQYRSRRDRIAALEGRVLQNPMAASHGLSVKRGVDLRGKRTRHDEGGKFVVLYMVCQECVDNGYRKAGYNDCDGCEDIPPNGVIFLAYGQHDDVYSRYWRARIQKQK